MAVKKGYKLVEVHEVCEYEVTQYDPQNSSIGLIVRYIGTFLNLKADASGYPGWVQSPAFEDRYNSEFGASEAFQLDKDAIGSTPAKRSLAKLCLNSMWGNLT